jgi:hypothetical protein
MKIWNVLIIGFSILAMLSGCKKEDDKELVDPFESEFSENSVEENKASLEDAGQEFVNELGELKNTQAISVLANFGSMAESMGEEPAMEPVKMIVAIAEKDYSAQQTLSALKSVAEEPNSLTALWEEVEGKYTWNSAQEDWDFTNMSDVVIFEFPGMEGDQSNTAVITIDNFSALTLVDPVVEFDEGTEPQLPTSLNIDIQYDGTSIASYIFEATYQDNGMPTSLNTRLTVADFSYQVDLEHTPYSEMSLTSSFRHKDNILIEGHIDNTGNWSQENIENVSNSESESEIPSVEEILANSNAYIQVMNIKVAGSVNLEGLAPDLRTIEEQFTNEDDEYTLAFNDSLANAINSNAQLVIVYADNHEKIAEVEAYPYYDEYWDEYTVDLRFVFADESAADAETYFGEGFSDLISDINAFIAEVNTDYGLDVEPIEE